MTRKEMVVKAYENKEIKQDVFGQLAMFNFTDEIIEKAVEREWITTDFAEQLLAIK